MKSSMLKAASIAALAMFSVSTAHSAALLQPDGASASSQASGLYDAGNTIDGSGLPGGFMPADAHADYAGNNHWTSDGSAPLDEFIEWTFTNPVDLFSIVIWNHRSNIISANNEYEPILFDLLLSDAADNPLLTLNDVALLPDTATGQIFGLGGTITGVSKVRFDVEQTQGSPNYTGLAEVAFNADVPETETPVAPVLPLIGGGLLALALVRSVRRSKA